MAADGRPNAEVIPHATCGAFRVAVSLRFMRSWGHRETAAKLPETGLGSLCTVRNDAVNVWV